MANSVLNYIINVMKKGNGDKQTVTALNSVKSVMTGVGVAVGVATTAYVAFDKIIGESSRKTVKDADEVRKLSSVTKQNAVETSKLIQVADDYKVTSEQLLVATKRLATQGYGMSIDTLAKLSDQYKSLNTAQERQQFLTKNFGKTGSDYITLLEAGGDALMRNNDAVNENLILTDQQVTAARELEIQQDQLNEVTEAYALLIGKEVIPVQIQWSKAWLALATDTVKLRNALDHLIAAPIDSATQSYMAWAEAIEAANRAALGLPPAIEEATAETQDFKGELDGLLNFAEGYQNHQQTMKGLEEELAEARKRGYSETGSKITEIKGKIEEAKAAEKRWADQFVLNMAMMQAAADGIDPAEAAGLLEMATQMGLINSDAASAYSNLMKLNGLNIENSVTTTYIAIRESETYSVGGRTGRSNRASGGPLTAGWTRVGEHGAELIDPGGYVHSNAESRRLVAAGVTPFRSLAVGGAVFSEPGDVFNPVVRPTGIASLPTLSSFIASGGSFTALAASARSSSSSSVATATTAPAVAATIQAATVQVESAQAVQQAAGAITESNIKTENATKIQTEVSKAQQDALLSEVRGLRNDIKNIIPKAISDGYQKVVGA